MLNMTLTCAGSIDLLYPQIYENIAQQMSLLKMDMCKEIQKLRAEMMKPDPAAQLIRQKQATFSENREAYEKPDINSPSDTDRMKSEVMGSKTLLDLAWAHTKLSRYLLKLATEGSKQRNSLI